VLNEGAEGILIFQQIRKNKFCLPKIIDRWQARLQITALSQLPTTLTTATGRWSDRSALRRAMGVMGGKIVLQNCRSSLPEI